MTPPAECCDSYSEVFGGDDGYNSFLSGDKITPPPPPPPVRFSYMPLEIFRRGHFLIWSPMGNGFLKRPIPNAGILLRQPHPRFLIPSREVGSFVVAGAMKAVTRGHGCVDAGVFSEPGGRRKS